MKDKVSGAIAIPKASWACAPALPNRIRVVFLKQAAGSEIPVPCFWHTDSCGFPRRTSLRENSLSHPAKGGSTPAFACQRAAIAPLPCPNLQC